MVKLLCLWWSPLSWGSSWVLCYPLSWGSLCACYEVLSLEVSIVLMVLAPLLRWLLCWSCGRPSLWGKPCVSCGEYILEYLVEPYLSRVWSCEEVSSSRVWSCEEKSSSRVLSCEERNSPLRFVLCLGLLLEGTLVRVACWEDLVLSVWRFLSLLGYLESLLLLVKWKTVVYSICAFMFLK